MLLTPQQMAAAQGCRPSTSSTRKESHGARRPTQRKVKLLLSHFSPPPPDHPMIPQTCYPRPADTFEYVTREQIKKAIDKLNAFKAPGPDGVPNVVLKKAATTLINHLYFIFRAIFELDVYPEEWKESTTIVLRKPGKLSYEEPKAYHPIALLNTLGKLFSSIVADELSHFCETRNVFPPNQFGGRPSRCTTDSMLLLTHKIKDAWRNRKVASVLFLDVQGAFPNVVKEVLIHNMRIRGTPPEYIKVTEQILTGRKTKLSFDDFSSSFIPINNGNNQGCPLSMIYYAFYNAGLLEISLPNASDETQFGYVDDVAILATGNDLAETHRKLANMMTRPKGAFDWSESHNSQFELSKLAIMDFSTKPQPSAPLTITHPLSHRITTIKSVQSYRFLGVLFDPKLKWTAQRDQAARSAAAWINLVRRLARTSTGISAKGMRQLYISVAIPKMSYAAEVWYIVPHLSTATAQKRTGAIKFTQKLISEQRRATITILGAMRTTAGDMLNTHAAIPPPHILFLKSLTRAATRLVTLPTDHPLHKPSQQACRRMIKQHPSPLHFLFATTAVKSRNYETILIARGCHNYKILANINIEEDRDKAIEYANQIEGTAVFTDGSGFEHNIGAATVLTRNGFVSRTLKYHLGSDETHTVYEAEATAVILGIHALCATDRTYKHVTIGLDNQAVLMALKSQKSRPGHHILDRIHDALEDFQVIQARKRDIAIKGYRRSTGRTKLKDSSAGWKEWKLKQWCRVDLIWTPGHEGIEGNERADIEAKNAAKGDSSDKVKLPNFLKQKQLPISISATRQTLKKDLKARWATEWTSSP